MKIAICDDTQSDLENLKNCLVEYFNEKQIPFSIDGFNNCNVLLNRIKKTHAILFKCEKV